MSEVVALDDTFEVEAELRGRIVALERRVSMLTAVLRLVLAIVRVSDFGSSSHGWRTPGESESSSAPSSAPAR